MTLRPSFSIFQVQRVRVFSTGSTILQVLQLSWHHQLVCHISYFFTSLKLSLCVYYTFLFFVSFSFSRTLAPLAGTIHSFLLLYPTTMVFGQPFTSSNGKTDKLAKRGALLKPFTVPCTLSSLTLRHHSFWTASVLLNQSFSSYRFSQYPLKNLCLLITFALSSFVFAATEAVFC